MDHKMVRDKQSFGLLGSVCRFGMKNVLRGSPSKRRSALRRFSGWLHRTVRTWPPGFQVECLQIDAFEIGKFGWVRSSDRAECLFCLSWSMFLDADSRSYSTGPVELQSPRALGGQESLSFEDKRIYSLSAMSAIGMTKNVDPDFQWSTNTFFCAMTIDHRRTRDPLFLERQANLFSQKGRIIGVLFDLNRKFWSL